MNYRTIIDKLDTEEWMIPEKFLSEHEEFLQALVDKVEEQCNIDLVSKQRELLKKWWKYFDKESVAVNCNEKEREEVINDFFNCG